MDPSFLKELYIRHKEAPPCPSPQVVSQFYTDLLGALFPNFSDQEYKTLQAFEHHLNKLKIDLNELVFTHGMYSRDDADQATESFFKELPEIYRLINTDVTAMYQGDPAAKSPVEVVRSYPGFYAIAAYRVAHVLHHLNVKIIPRMITEHAHSQTGIDIHPGATIGENFCIDHGTGIVIGETTLIGNNVKIYQGVTLGALSVAKEDASKKRHPTIEDHVVIYSGSTILGGKTIIGHHSVIGGNVWLTKTVKPYSKVYYTAQMSNTDTGKNDLLVYKPHSR